MDWFIHYFYIGAIVTAWHRHEIRELRDEHDWNKIQKVGFVLIMIMIWPAYMFMCLWEKI